MNETDVSDLGWQGVRTSLGAWFSRSLVILGAILQRDYRRSCDPAHSYLSGNRPGIQREARAAGNARRSGPYGLSGSSLIQELHSPLLGCILSLIGPYLTHERPTRPVSKAKALGWGTGPTFCSRGPDRSSAYLPSEGDSLPTKGESSVRTQVTALRRESTLLSF